MQKLKSMKRLENNDEEIPLREQLTEVDCAFGNGVASYCK